MNPWIRFFAREAALILAFVILGTLLLVSFWMTSNVERSFVQEFRQDRLSVVIAPESLEGFERFAQSEPDVLRYEVQSEQENRELLIRLYPELEAVLGEISEGSFPLSATLVSENGTQLLGKLERQPNIIQAQLLHQAPDDLRLFLGVATGLLSFLWIFTLVMFLYFQLERIALREQRRWSLMKLLGAKASRVFIPIWRLELLRLSLATVLAVGAAYGVSTWILNAIEWPWQLFSVWQWGAFLVLSLGLGSALLYLLFVIRYREVSLG